MSGTNPMYVEDATPIGLWQYRARIWFDPNSATMTGGAATIFEGRNGANSLFRIQLQKSGSYQLRAGIINDAGGWADTGWHSITDAPHSVDLYWAAATAGGANNGYVKLSVDGLLRQSVTGVDNDTLRLEEARLGAMSIPDGMSGALYFDGFQSWGYLPAPFRYTEYEYVTDPSPSVWMIDRVRRQTSKDGNGNTLAETLYAYDGTAASIGTKGELTLQQVVSGSQTIDTTFEYDTYGNLIKSRAYEAYGSPGTLPSGGNRLSQVGYDTTLYTYAVSQTNPLNQTASASYQFELGAATATTDINNNTTSTTYDGLGRVTGITYPGYAQPNVNYLYPALPITLPFKLELQAWDETAGVYRSAWTMYDGLGRALQVQGPGETGGQLIVVDTKYDARGLTWYSGLPRTVTGSGGSYYAPDWVNVPHAAPSYDALGRLTSTLFADGTSASVIYNGLRTAARDQNNHQKIQEVDAFGRLVKVEEYTGTNPYTLYATTNYQYDERNLLKQVSDAQGNITAILYDGFGRKTEMTDPDMGNWRYRYDTLGNLGAQIDAKRQAINFYYDALNRLAGKTYNAGPVNPDTYQPPADPGYAGYAVKYYYDSGADGKGHRTSMEDASGTATWAYNALGQVTGETRVVSGQSSVMSYQYDAFGRTLDMTYPTGEAVTYNYRCNGLSSDPWGGIGCESDRVSQTVNGVTTNYVLDLAAGLTQVLSDGTNTYLYGNGRIGELQPGGFTYHLGDALGSVRQLTDATGGVTLAKSYEPYGSPLTTAGTGNSVFAFTGEQWDSQTQLLYLRARLYASSYGRFVQRDSWAGDAQRPMSLNGWLYVYANPANLTDPSGHDAWWCDELPEPERTNCRQRYYSAMVQLMLNGQRPANTPTDTPTATATCTATATSSPTPTLTPVPILTPPPDVLPATWNRYLEIRTQLPEVINPQTGTIDDVVFLAMIISSELGIEASNTDVYGEAKEGLSQQYYGYGCSGDCTSVEQQLKWANNMQGWSVFDVVKNYVWYLDDAEQVKGNGSAYVYPGNGGTLDAWWWGNYDWNGTQSPLGDYFRSGEDPAKAYWWTRGGKPYLAHDPNHKFVVLTFWQSLLCGDQSIVRAINSGKNCLGF